MPISGRGPTIRSAWLVKRAQVEGAFSLIYPNSPADFVASGAQSTSELVWYDWAFNPGPALPASLTATEGGDTASVSVATSPISYVGGKTATTTGTILDWNTVLTDLTGGSAAAPIAGDTVFVDYGVGGTADIALGVQTAGYAEVAELYVADTFATNMSVSWKRMGVTPDTSVDLSPTTDLTFAGSVTIHVWRGLDATTPFDVTSTTATGIDTILVDPPAITPITAGAIILAAGAGAHNKNAQTFGASLSNFRTATGDSAGSDVTTGMGSFVWTSGAYDPAVWTFSVGPANSMSWAAVTMALRPATTSNDLSFAVTEGGDSASFTLTAAHTAALAATEAGDTASFTADVILSTSLAATEGGDTASFTLSARHTANLAASEAGDTASFSASVILSTSLAATEAGDSASFALTAAHTASLAATEGGDTASATVQLSLLTSLAATEAGDMASFALSAAHTASLAATESGDVAAFAVSQDVTVTLTATEAGDTASFTLLQTATIALDATEGGDVASATVVAVGSATINRGDDAFRTSGQRARFWASKAEEWVEDRLEQLEEVVLAPRKSRKKFAANFLAKIETLDVPEVQRDLLADLMAQITAPSPDLSAFAAQVIAWQHLMARKRRRWRDDRDLQALIALGAI